MEGEFIAQISQPVQRRDYVTFRPPRIEDGKAMWRTAAGLPSLDLNSPYAYLLVCRDFSPTSAVAVDGGSVVGFLSGLRSPRDPAALFVWQVGVALSHQGLGLAKRMVLSIVERPGLDIAFIEATVTPSNTASRRLFSSVATELGAQHQISACFPSSLFPDPSAHEDEELHRIGPIRTAPNSGQRA